MSVKEILQNPQELGKIVRLAFETVDTDKSGFLNQQELRALMESVSKDLGVANPSEEEVTQALHALDQNKDSKLSCDEFSILIRQVLETML